jgi:hypothetical protein
MKPIKSKKINKRQLPRLPRLPRRRKKSVDERFSEAVQTLPDITTDTVAAHREQILSSARKYIYPLSHSKHRIVFISVSLVTVGVILFFAYCGLALYRFQYTSGFLYGVTQVIPFPVAKAGPSFIDYENYLFELRHYIHYYQSQEQVDFNSVSGEKQLDNYKQQAMQTVIDYAYVKQLAAKYKVTVTSKQVNDEINLEQSENRLGNNQKEFAEVLNEFWGWSIADFKRELTQQLLAQNLVSYLDTSTHERAQMVLTQLVGGANFANMAMQYSDDASTKGNGGNFGFSIDASNQDLPPQTLNALLSLKPGQISGIINLGNALEIDKVISNTNGQIQAAHILFNFKSINTYIQPLQAKEKPHIYINVKL